MSRNGDASTAVEKSPVPEPVHGATFSMSVGLLVLNVLPEKQLFAAAVAVVVFGNETTARSAIPEPRTMLPVTLLPVDS